MVITWLISSCQMQSADRPLWTWLLRIIQITSGLWPIFSGTFIWWSWKSVYDSSPVTQSRSAGPLPGFTDGSASILPCQWSPGKCAKTPFPFWLASTTQSLAALGALRRTFDKEDPRWVGELRDFQSDSPKHWEGWPAISATKSQGYGRLAHSRLSYKWKLWFESSLRQSTTQQGQRLLGGSVTFQWLPPLTVPPSISPDGCPGPQSLYGGIDSGKGRQWTAFLFL